MIERGIPKWVAILVVLIGLLGLSSLVPLVITGSYVQFIQELPAYQERADLLFEQSSAWMRDYGYDSESLRAIFDPAAALGYVQVVLAALGGILSRYFLDHAARDFHPRGCATDHLTMAVTLLGKSFEPSSAISPSSFLPAC